MAWHGKASFCHGAKHDALLKATFVPPRVNAIYTTVLYLHKYGILMRVCILKCCITWYTCYSYLVQCYNINNRYACVMH